MVTAWPKDLPGVGVGAQRLADRIGELTEGRLTVSVHPVGELVRGQDNMDAVMDGTADMSHDLSTYYLGKSPAFAFFSSVPFGLVAASTMPGSSIGGGQALWDELGRRFGVQGLPRGQSRRAARRLVPQGDHVCRGSRGPALSRHGARRPGARPPQSDAGAARRQRHRRADARRTSSTRRSSWAR